MEIEYLFPSGMIFQKQFHGLIVIIIEYFLILSGLKPEKREWYRIGCVRFRITAESFAVWVTEKTETVLKQLSDK